MPCSCLVPEGVLATRSRRISAFYPRRSAGFRRVVPVGRRTKGRRLMAQQKSEDRVVLEGGVMPAEPAGSSPGGQGKAAPVEETAVQLCLPIATAEVAHASPRAMGVPKAIVK